jgi:hypothetical protein
MAIAQTDDRTWLTAIKLSNLKFSLSRWERVGVREKSGEFSSLFDPHPSPLSQKERGTFS